MTAPMFLAHLQAALNGPLGSDVEFGVGPTRTRGILTREERLQDSGDGLSVPVWVTTLTVRDGTLPGIGRESTVTVYPPAADWLARSGSRVGTDYKVRGIGRVDDLGAREYVLAVEP